MASPTYWRERLWLRYVRTKRRVTGTAGLLWLLSPLILDLASMARKSWRRRKSKTAPRNDGYGTEDRRAEH